MSRYDKALGHKRETVTREMLEKAAAKKAGADRSLGTSISFSVASPGRNVEVFQVMTDYFKLEKDMKVELLQRLQDWIQAQRAQIEPEDEDDEFFRQLGEQKVDGDDDPHPPRSRSDELDLNLDNLLKDL